LEVLVSDRLQSVGIVAGLRRTDIGRFDAASAYRYDL